MRAVCRLVAAAALALLCVLAPAHAWGPLTHFDMGCKAVMGETNVVECLQQYTADVGAMELPDACYFPPHFIQGHTCSDLLVSIHDPIFAGYAVLMANETSAPSGQLQWALSFGSHALSDNGGFLTGYLAEPGEVNWLTVWQFMTALDAYVAQDWVNVSGATPATIEAAVTAALQPISSANAQWLSEAAMAYQQVDPTFPNITAEDIVTCSTEWVPSILPMTLQATRTPSDWYQEQIPFYDGITHNTTYTWEEASSRFLAYRQCGQDAVTVWQNALMAGSTPEKAFAIAATQCLACQA